MSLLKKIAKDFLSLVASGHSGKAFQLYASKAFKHHNPYFKGDATSLIRAMEADAKANPEKTLSIHRLLADGEFVTVHSHIKQSPTDVGFAVVHIFRFEENKISELWDLGQSVPPDSPNENGMF